MSQDQYQHYPFYYNKSGRVRPGARCDLVPAKIKKEDPAKEDRENRKKIVNLISGLIETGMTLEEAVKNVLDNKDNQEIISKFGYLRNSNLEEIFSNWYKGKTREKREVEK